jgi:molecular chaperone DnaK
VEVTFDIDADGILNVSARDKATGREQKVTIQAGSGLSKEDVDRLVREAEAHASEDRRRREEIEVRNHADSAAYQAERTLKELGDRVPLDGRQEVEGRIAAVRAATQSGIVDHIRTTVEALEEALQRLGQAVYAGGGAEGSFREGGPQVGQTPDDTVEGEFREI